MSRVSIDRLIRELESAKAQIGGGVSVKVNDAYLVKGQLRMPMADPKVVVYKRPKLVRIIARS